MPGPKKAEVKKINTVPALLGADSLLEKTIKKKKDHYTIDYCIYHRDKTSK